MVFKVDFCNDRECWTSGLQKQVPQSRNQGFIRSIHHLDGMDPNEVHSSYRTVSFSTNQDLSIVVDFFMAATGMVPIDPQLAGGYSDPAAIPWRPNSQDADRELLNTHCFYLLTVWSPRSI